MGISYPPTSKALAGFFLAAVVHAIQANAINHVNSIETTVAQRLIPVGIHEAGRKELRHKLTQRSRKRIEVPGTILFNGENRVSNYDSRENFCIVFQYLGEVSQDKARQAAQALL